MASSEQHRLASRSKVIRPVTMNSEQLEELYSLECIYEDSKEVSLQRNSEVELEATVAISAGHRIEMKIVLPEQYLHVDAAVPSYGLTSTTLSQDQLRLLHEQLDSLTTSPVLFSWIEWLRTEAYSLIRPHQKVASERTPSADDFIDYNDIPEDGEDATGFCANCIEPRVAGEVQLRACGHWLCDTCSSYTWQVYHAQERQPRCPVPNCKTLTTQLGTECALELWLKVSKHIGNTWFQESIVFCPGCEDRGMDIPVLVQPGKEGFHKSSQNCSCRCFQCHLRFCGICRSPQHPGQSCFDSERRVVRMAKRRPPLPEELAELAAAKAEEIRRKDQRQAEMAFSLSQGSNSFQDLLAHFEGTFGPTVMEALEGVLEDVQLEEIRLSQEVQNRFFKQISKNGMGEMRPAFHGTNADNYPSIFERGLLIPGLGLGADLEIVHGAAHGRGIYTANVDAAWLSKGFCTKPSMLVCAVLDSDKQVHHVGDAMVVMDPAYIVPLFLAFGQWQVPRPCVPPPTRLAFVPNPRAPPKDKAEKAEKAEKCEKLEGEKKSDAKPKAKQKKFLARLAARSKR